MVHPEGLARIQDLVADNIGDIGIDLKSVGLEVLSAFALKVGPDVVVELVL